MPHQLALQKGHIPRPPATIQNYSNASNRLFKRRYPTNETQPKYGPTKCERSAHAECGKN